MATVTHEDRETIDGFLASSSRLRSLLHESFRLGPEEIKKIRLEDEHRKVDLMVGRRLLRFKALDDENVLVPNEAVDGVSQRYDPWLAQDLLGLIKEYSARTPVAVAPERDAKDENDATGENDAKSEKVETAEAAADAVGLPVADAPAPATRTVAAKAEETAAAKAPKRSWWKLWKRPAADPAPAPDAAEPEPAPEAPEEKLELFVEPEEPKPHYDKQDLADVKSALSDYAMARDEISLERCFQLLKRFEVPVGAETAKRQEFYSGYADEVLRLISMNDAVASTKLRIRIEALAHDLAASGVAGLQAKGLEIKARLVAIDKRS